MRQQDTAVPEQVPEPVEHENARSLQIACGGPVRLFTHAAMADSDVWQTGWLPELRSGSGSVHELGGVGARHVGSLRHLLIELDANREIESVVFPIADDGITTEFNIS